MARQKLCLRFNRRGQSDSQMVRRGCAGFSACRAQLHGQLEGYAQMETNYQRTREKVMLKVKISIREGAAAPGRGFTSVFSSPPPGLLCGSVMFVPTGRSTETSICGAP